MDIQEAIQHCRDVANGCPAGDRDCAYQYDHLADWLEELAAYRDAMPLKRAQELTKAEQDGRLMVPPCKVGDVVYLLHSRCDGIHSARVNRIEMTKTRMERDFVLCLDLGDGRQETFRWASDKGRTWFSSKKEAEAAVAKMIQ